MKPIFLISMFFIFCQIHSSKSQTEKNQVSERYIGDKNYTKILKQYLINEESTNIIAILFTNKNCQTCDVFEPDLIKIQKNFSDENIPTFRCEISENKIISDKFVIKRFPVVHFIYKKPVSRDEQYPDIKIYKTTQILAQKILQIAKYLQKILNFLQTQKLSNSLIQTLQEIPFQDRIIVNIEELKQFYQYDEKDFVNTVMIDESFNSMPIVPLSKQLFEFYVISNDLQNFMEQSRSEVIIFIALQQQSGGPFMHIPIEIRQFQRLISKNLDLVSIFKSFLFYSAQQLTESLYNFQQELYSMENHEVPIYLAVVDTIWNRAEARRQVMMLNRVICTFEKETIIFWIEAEINPEKKLLLGFDKNTKPPMFGKLILAKNQPKQPLKNFIKNIPIFSQVEIKTRIRTDLGYQKLLPQKIRFALQELGVKKLIQLTNMVETRKNRSEIVFSYCTSKYISNDQIENLKFLIERFKRFYRHSNLKILTQPCLINDASIQDGIYISFQEKSYLISQQIVSCKYIESIIQKVTIQFASQLKRQKIVPNYFCIPQNQMKDFLMNLED